MPLKSTKRVYSSSYFKRKTLDNILKAKEKFILKGKTNSNKTDYSSIGPGKTSLNNNEIKYDNSKSLFSENKLKSKISLKKTENPPIRLNFFFSSTSNTFRKFFENNKNNNIFINFKNINNNSKIKNNKDKENKEKIKYSYNQDCKIFQQLNNSTSKEENISKDKNNNKFIRTFNKKLTFNHLNNLIKQYKYKINLQNEKEKLNDKICLLKKDFKVKNFILNPDQVIDYLDLNEKNNFFQSSTFRKTINKYSKKFNFLKNNRLFYRNRSTPIENRIQRIKSIYPTVLNIEGHRNRKILYELNDEKKKKKKNEIHNCVYYRHHFNLQKRMIKERNKAEESAKANLSDLAYKSQLLILSMKMYQRAIHQLEKKNSFKISLDLPLYNLFLNLD